MLTRQHYQAFAEMVRKVRDRKDQEQLVIEMIRLFKKENSQFQPGKFVEAVGIEETPHLSKVMHHEGTSPTGGKKSFKMNEAFEGMKMKLGPLLPVAQLEARGTLVREAPYDPRVPNDEVYSILEELHDNLDEIEDTNAPGLERLLMDARLEAKRLRWDLQPLSAGILKEWLRFWVSARKSVDAEIKKLEGKR